MAARLPVPDSDADAWGGILNEFLQVSHNTDGTIKSELLRSGSNTYVVIDTTEDYVVTPKDHIVLADATGGPITVTLPSAKGTNKGYTIKKTDPSPNVVTVLPVEGQTIDDGSTAALGAQYASVSIVPHNAQWFVI